MTRRGRPPVTAADAEARRALWCECRRILRLPLADLARVAGLTANTARAYSSADSRSVPSWVVLDRLRSEMVMRQRAEVVRRALDLADAEAALARLESHIPAASRRLRETDRQEKRHEYHRRSDLEYRK